MVSTSLGEMCEKEARVGDEEVVSAGERVEKMEKEKNLPAGL